MASTYDATEAPMNDGFQRPPPGAGGTSKGPVQKIDGATGEDDADLLTDGDWIRMFKDSLRGSSDFMQQQLRSGWSRSYRAFGNRHVEGSKYSTPRYRTRTQLFKPKTRMAVRKNDASAAAALFSVSDVVNISAELATDQRQVMTARFVSAALNYRLDRSTRMTGPNWFMTAIGARQDAQVTGVCISKQYWAFEERTRQFVRDVPEIDEESGNPLYDGESGNQMTREEITDENVVIEDRIMCDLFPAELCFVDFAADWRDPIQAGGFFGAAYPVRLNDLETLVRKNADRPRTGGSRWRSDLNVRELTKGRGAEARRNDSVRRARDRGQDRYETRFSDRRSDTIWIYEWFYRYNGEDWTWWMLGESIMLSDPVPTHHAYPEQKGDRPYTMGVGALETHKTHPMSPVESWQPLQMELNEITNLTLDAQKMAVSPITKIVRGKNIDWKQVQGRGPDAMIMVDAVDDVTFEKAPGASGAEQIQLNNLNVDFDELSGTFSQGSVQTNRQMNETVGGMNILSGSASNMTEFDLRVWGETWFEPTVRQLCRLIQFYESSETVIAVAGATAGLISFQGEQPSEPGPLEQPPAPGSQPISVEEVLSNLDSAQISVKVNIGIGAQSPQQKLQNFGIATDQIIKLAGVLDADGIIPSGKAFMDDLMGIIGKKDGDKYFKPKPQNDQPPPEVMKIQLEMELLKQKGEQEAKARDQEFQLRQQEAQMEMMKMMAEMRADQQRMQMELSAMREKQQLEVQGQRIKTQGMIESQRIKAQGQVTDQRIKQQGTIEGHLAHRAVAEDEHAMSMEHAEADHQFQQRQADATHRQGLEQSKEQAKAKVQQMKAQAAAKPKPQAKPAGKQRGK